MNNKYSIVLLLFFFFISSCATKVRTPLNRMVSPESIGGSMNSEIQIAKTSSVQGRFDVSEDQPYPIQQNVASASSYWLGVSLLESMDFFWWHTSSTPSLFGLRYQIFGSPQLQNPQGHSLAITAALGGNEHETNSNPKLTMEIAARDFSMIYGLWILPYLQANTSIFYSSFDLSGKLKSSSDPTLNSNLDYTNKQIGMTLGLTLRWSAFNFKTEYAYTQSKWSDSSSKTFSSLGFGVGILF